MTSRKVTITGALNISRILGGFRSIRREVKSTSQDMKGSARETKVFTRNLTEAEKKAIKMAAEVSVISNRIDAARKKTGLFNATLTLTDRLFKKIATSSMAAVMAGFRRLPAVAGASFSILTSIFRRAFGFLRSVATDAFGTITTWTRRLAIGITGIGAAAVWSANRQRQAYNELDRNLRRNGTTLDDYRRRLERLTNVAKGRSVRGDDSIVQVLNAAFQYDASLSLAERLIPAAINFAAVRGITPGEAAERIAKTFAGTPGELGEQLPSLRIAMRNMNEEQRFQYLRGGGAIDVVQQLYGGRTGWDAAQAERDAAPWKTLLDRFDDLLQRIGDALLPTVDRITTKITKVLEDLEKYRWGALFNNIWDIVANRGQETMVAIGRSLGVAMQGATRVFGASLSYAIQGAAPVLAALFDQAIESSSLGDALRKMGINVPTQFGAISGNMTATYVEQMRNNPRGLRRLWQAAQGRSWTQGWDFNQFREAYNTAADIYAAHGRMTPAWESLFRDANARGVLATTPGGTTPTLMGGWRDIAPNARRISTNRIANRLGLAGDRTAQYLGELRQIGSQTTGAIRGIWTGPSPMGGPPLFNTAAYPNGGSPSTAGLGVWGPSVTTPAAEAPAAPSSSVPRWMTSGFSTTVSGGGGMGGAAGGGGGVGAPIGGGGGSRGGSTGYYSNHILSAVNRSFDQVAQANFALVGATQTATEAVLSLLGLRQVGDKLEGLYEATAAAQVMADYSQFIYTGPGARSGSRGGGRAPLRPFGRGGWEGRYTPTGADYQVLLQGDDPEVAHFRRRWDHRQSQSNVAGRLPMGVS